MGVTKIQWTDYTFNPFIGCSKVHTGCANCYAEADMDKRRGRVKWGPNGTRSKTSDVYWREPYKWNREAEKAGVRARVFCASLSDIFEDWKGPILNHKGERLMYRGDRYDPEHPITVASDHVDDDAYGLVRMDDLRRDLFKIIDETPWLDWQLLTKRPENVKQMWNTPTSTVAIGHGMKLTATGPEYRNNVWLGTSISDQETADEFIPKLLANRDLVRYLFLSAEPLVGEISLSYKPGTRSHLPGCLLDEIDWVIVGGESGKDSRVCDILWIRSIVKQCKQANVPVFVKQLGRCVYFTSPGGQKSRVWPKDQKGGDTSEWPTDLVVQEFPNGSNRTGSSGVHQGAGEAPQAAARRR
jgi:protein gp37